MPISPKYPHKKPRVCPECQRLTYGKHTCNLDDLVKKAKPETFVSQFSEWLSTPTGQFAVFYAIWQRVHQHH